MSGAYTSIDIDVSDWGFTVVPLVFVTSYSTNFFGYAPSGSTTTTIKAGVSHRQGTGANGTVVDISWVAVQMTETSAAGEV
jgi:hypothetical protein